MTKLLLIPKRYNSNLDNFDGVIIGLKDYSVNYDFCLDINEIEMYIKNNNSKEVFIAINKNLSNNDLNNIELILKRLDTLRIKGILFYDLSVLYIKQKFNLSVDLVWNQTHMVTNYNTCNYYYNEGCKYAYLSNEITLDEMLEICDKSSIGCMVFLFGHSTIAHSKRKLLTNYFKYINKEKIKDKYVMLESHDNSEYIIKEDNIGTTILNGKLLNGIRPLFKLNGKIKYAVVEENDNNNFNELSLCFRKAVDSKENNQEEIIEKINSLYPDTTEGFFYKRTIYKVKKDA